MRYRDTYLLLDAFGVELHPADVVLGPDLTPKGWVEAPSDTPVPHWSAYRIRDRFGHHRLDPRCTYTVLRRVSAHPEWDDDDPEFSAAAWRHAVASGATQLGYHAWAQRELILATPTPA